MPGLDRTGPKGEGPRTGGGFGFCTPNSTKEKPTNTQTSVRPRLGRGLGPCGRGLARTFRGSKGRRRVRR